MTFVARALALDEAGARALNELTRRSSGARLLAHTASGGLAGAEILLMGVLALRGHRRTALRMLYSVCIIYLTSEAIGLVLARQRPFAQVSDVQELVSHHPARSFPSRHVASAVSMALVARDSDRRLARAMALAAALLGVSRVAAGLHYPSDVVAGAVLGLTISRYVRKA